MISTIRSPNWWRGLTTLEKCLTLSCIFLVVFIIGLVIVLSLELPSKQSDAGRLDYRSTISEDDNSTICLTSECIHTASTILEKIKPEVQPCDDFFQFACGAFIENEVIPEDAPNINAFTKIFDKQQEQIREIVTEERPATDPKFLHIPNKLYKACMNKTSIENLRDEPIRKIAKSLGDWPVIKGDDWDLENKWTWQETTKNFRRLGFSIDYIIDFSVDRDLKNNQRRILELDQSTIGFNREYLIKGFNDTLVLDYFDLMVDMAVLFGANRERALEELHESLEFEIALANISWPAEKRRNPNDLYNVFTIKQLQEKYPYMQWLAYIKALLPAELQIIDENEPTNLIVPSFFDDLGPLLTKTSKRAIANYMMWRIHITAVPFLSEKFRKRNAEFLGRIYGIQETKPRWNKCAVFASSIGEKTGDEYILPLAIGSLYVRKYFNNESKALALEMFNDIRAVFSTILDEVDWMDAMTKQNAQKKLHAMITYIGYADEILDYNILVKYYEKLEVDEEHYFQSFLNMNIFGTDYSLSKLRLPVDGHDWTLHASPTDINAYNSITDNSIELPAAILQDHFFNANRPKYMNYGAIGFVIGHEITHGFDDQGRQFDVKGNLVDWWRNETQTAFLEKARCIIAQYGNYTDKQTGLKLNGINTQGETIADNGGAKEAYLAYKRWAAKHGPEPKLPGLHYTPEQLFWISLAQTWCTKDRTESIRSLITTNEHPTFELRVLGLLKNMRDFSKDFQCPEGSPMNPTHKCAVW